MPRLGATHSKSERFLCVCFFHKLVFHFVIRLEVVGGVDRDLDPQVSLHKIYIPSVSFYPSPSWVRSSAPVDVIGDHCQ